MFLKIFLGLTNKHFYLTQEGINSLFILILSCNRRENRNDNCHLSKINMSVIINVQTKVGFSNFFVYNV